MSIEALIDRAMTGRPDLMAQTVRIRAAEGGVRAARAEYNPQILLSGSNLSALRTMREAVEYEFGDDREQHIRSSEVILQAAALIWNQVAVLHGK